MNKWMTRYLKVRAWVLFMANPIFYVVAYGVAIFLILLSGRDGIIGEALFGLWGLMKDFTSTVFLAGTGEHQKDVHLIITVLLPSLIAYAWWSIEKVTGVRGHLERLGYID